MALRLLITDAVCSTLEPLLRESKHAAGAPPRLSDRLVIDSTILRAHQHAAGAVKNGGQEA